VIDHKGKNLVFLLSMPRSGSTVLSLMLGSHPEICCPPEPWIVLALAEYFGLSNISSTPYGREWAEIAAIEFLLSAERKQRGALSKALRVIGNTSHLDAITAARQTLQAAYQLQLDVTGKSVFIDKTPRYYAVLGLIEEVFPKAKKIILLRNPLDIFASYKSTWEVNRSIFTPEGVSVHTRDFCEGLFKFADYVSVTRDDVLVIRYEDLANDAEGSLRSACQFSDIDFSPSMLDYYKNTTLIEEYRQSSVGDPISSNKPAPTNNRTVNAWEKRLDRADIEALVNILGVDVFERLGYGDTVIRLQDLFINTPTEDQVFERRKLLMQTLVKNVHEQPFSTWKNFVSPLNDCLMDRAARLEVIDQLHAEVTTSRLQLEVSETDSTARLTLIHELEERLQFTQADSTARLTLIHELEERLQFTQADSESISQLLQTSENSLKNFISLYESVNSRLVQIESSRTHRFLKKIGLFKFKTIFSS